MTEKKEEQKAPEAQAAATAVAEPQPEAQKPRGVPPLPPFKGLMGLKLGMTRVFDDHGRAVSATVIQAGPCQVVQVKTPAHDGYAAVTLGFGEASKQQTNKARTGIFSKANLKPTRWLREFRVASAEGFQAGQVVETACFTKGDHLDISGVNKGKGFQGVVKRHRFRGGPRTHGQSDRLRAPGSSGGQGPQRVTKGHRQPGHMGFEMSTVQAVRVIHVDPEQHLLAIEGAVPGPNGNLLVMRPTVKKITIHVPQVHHAKAAKAEKAKAKPAAATPAKAPAK